MTVDTDAGHFRIRCIGAPSTLEISANPTLFAPKQEKLFKKQENEMQVFVFNKNLLKI